MMYRNQLHKMVRRFGTALCAISMALAVGCGDGGTGGTGIGAGTIGVGTGGTAGVGSGGTGSGDTGGGTGIIRYAMAGSVADGYLINATVFLDKNGNYQPDADEPSAITGEKGSYTLNVDPADVGRYPIVALVIKGVTIDTDDNLPVENSYILSIPKESVYGVAGNFISPISSQLRELMETGEYATVQQAAQALKAKMGLPADTDINADYVAAKNRTLHAAAQNIAALMGNQNAQVMMVDGKAVSVDVRRYRRMMSAINSNLPNVMGRDRRDAVQCVDGAITTAVSGVPRQCSRQGFGNISSARQ